MPSTCSVSGNLQDLTGTGIAGFAVFTLANYGANVPRVVGTTMIASPKKVFQANGSGAISGNIWGNDNISPAGTVYFVTIEDNSRNPIATYAFNVTGTSFNLNNATPITVAPVVTAPTGDSTYLRLDAGNKPSAGPYFAQLISESANPAQSGAIQLAQNDEITYRNQSNNGDIGALTVVGSNVVLGSAQAAGVNIVPLVTTYNGTGLLGQGFPSIIYTVDLVNISPAGNIPATTIGATLGNGWYRVSAYIVIVQAATSSSTLPQVVLTWTDRDTNTVQTSNLTASGLTGNTVGLNSFGSAAVSAKTGTNLQYSTTGGATSGATPMNFNLRLKVEAIG